MTAGTLELEVPAGPAPKAPRRGSHRIVIPCPLDLDRLALPPLEVARLTATQRRHRLEQLVEEAHAILEWTIGAYVHGGPDVVKRDRRELAGIVGLFSGGNDSTTLMHLFRDQLTHAAHANTGIGVEETRQYVRDTCAAWGLPLLERAAPREEDSYRAHVLAHGYPGPGAHYKMFQRLKLRALEAVQRELVENPYRQRVVFVAGRRRTESDRRNSVPSNERIRSAVWCSPLVNWTKQDLTTYRLTHPDVPRNEVADLLHMSAECLCGSYAHAGERDEIEAWFPLAFEEVEELTRLIADRDDIKPWRKTWGWQGYPELLRMSRSKPPKRVGMLCESCEPGEQLDIMAVPA